MEHKLTSLCAPASEPLSALDGNRRRAVHRDNATTACGGQKNKRDGWMDAPKKNAVQPQPSLLIYHKYIHRTSIKIKTSVLSSGRAVLRCCCISFNSKTTKQHNNTSPVGHWSLRQLRHMTVGTCRRSLQGGKTPSPPAGRASAECSLAASRCSRAGTWACAAG